jgi:negative regulator of flagellin synthesis FlgM
MKIDKRLTSVSGSKAASPAQSAGVRKATDIKHGGKADKLHITASTSQLRELEAQLAKLDIGDAAKIKAIKLAIDNGTFKVDSEIVADQLIDSAKEAVRRRPKKA